MNKNLKAAFKKDSSVPNSILPGKRSLTSGRRRAYLDSATCSQMTSGKSDTEQSPQPQELEWRWKPGYLCPEHCLLVEKSCKGRKGWSQKVSTLQDMDLTVPVMSRFPAWFPEEAQPAHVHCLAQECVYSKLTGWFQPRNWSCKTILQIPQNRWLNRLGKPSQHPL